jgi:hypothetical protein
MTVAHTTTPSFFPLRWGLMNFFARAAQNHSSYIAGITGISLCYWLILRPARARPRNLAGSDGRAERTKDKRAESWGQVGWVLGCRRTTAAFTSFLFLYFFSSSCSKSKNCISIFGLS